MQRLRILRFSIFRQSAYFWKIVEIKCTLCQNIVLNKEETERLELFSSEIASRLTLPEPGGGEFAPPIISNWITAVRKRIWCSNLLNFQIEHIYVFMSNFKSVPTIRRPPGTEKVKNTPVQVGLSAIWRVASTFVIPWNIPTSEELGILLGLEDILNSRSLPFTTAN